jgi:hypothetical protein
VLLLTVNVSRYLFNNKKWVVQPALVADKSGARMFSYNPRIAILMNRLEAGNIYDRDGVLLATSKPELIKNSIAKLVIAGAQGYNIDSAMHKRLDRYYPFEEQMFFWTGDANTGVFNGSPMVTLPSTNMLPNCAALKCQPPIIMLPPTVTRRTDFWPVV